MFLMYQVFSITIHFTLIPLIDWIQSNIIFKKGSLLLRFLSYCLFKNSPFAFITGWEKNLGHTFCVTLNSCGEIQPYLMGFFWSELLQVTSPRCFSVVHSVSNFSETRCILFIFQFFLIQGKLYHIFEFFFFSCANHSLLYLQIPILGWINLVHPCFLFHLHSLWFSL